MKFNIRWQLLLAVIAISLVLALLSFQVQTAGLCTITVPASGGSFAEGFVGTPKYLNPLLSDGYPVDREIVSLLFDGLTRYDESGDLVPALAQSWSVSDDGLSVRFNLRPDITWHDGESFTASDVAYTYGLMQQDEFPGSEELKTLWKTVIITELDSTTIEFSLPELYSPFLDATTRGILPAHLMEEVDAVDLDETPFNRNPVGTGPFMVAPDQDWERTHRLRLIPNPIYWRQGVRIANFEFRFYPDDDSLLSAFKIGEVQAINNVASERIPELSILPDVRLFTAPSPRFTMLLFNQGESGSDIVKSLNLRQSLAYALDREALVDSILNGQGLMLEGPYLPSSWTYRSPLLTVYESRPMTATLLLEESGWLLPEGSEVRQLDGEDLSLRLVGMATPIHSKMAETIAGQWKRVGINTELALVSDFNAMHDALASGEFDVALVEVAPPGDPDLYDFWSQEAIIRGQNFAGWNHRRASEALENGRKLWDTADRRSHYETFLRYYDASLPALTLFQHVRTYAINSEINEVEIGRVSHPRERYETLADWFVLYRDVTVSCPSDEPVGEVPST